MGPGVSGLHNATQDVPQRGVERRGRRHIEVDWLDLDLVVQRLAQCRS